MGSGSDFIIGNGVLKKYLGSGKEIVIPQGITTIGVEAFARKGMVRVMMPDTVTKIEWGAFSSCRALEEVTLSRHLKTVETDAFFNCQSLKRIEFHPGLEKIGSCAFNGCRNLRQLILPEHPIEIGDDAFAACHALADENGFTVVRDVLYDYRGAVSNQMHIPLGVRQIDFCTTLNINKSIRSLSIPASVDTISERVFQGYIFEALESCRLDFAVADEEEAEHLVKKVFIWKGLANAYLLGNLHADPLVMEAVKKLTGSSAGRARFLRELTILEDSAPMERMLECMKKLPLEELDDCIEHAVHPAVRALLMDHKNKHYTRKTVERAENVKAEKALGLREKTLADYRKEFTIAKKDGCYHITGYTGSEQEVTVPARIGGLPVVVGERAFVNNDCAVTITLEPGITSIGAYAFTNCTMLTDIHIPASVTDFGRRNLAFYSTRGSKFTIHAPAGSAAEAHAKEMNISFIEEEGETI